MPNDVHCLKNRGGGGGEVKMIPSSILMVDKKVEKGSYSGQYSQEKPSLH